MSVSKPASHRHPPQALPRILEIASYQQGKSELEGHAEPIKLSSNESSFGPSPAATAAYHDAATHLHRYPDGTQRELREAIAEVHALDADRIVCGNGSEELIGLIIRAYVGEGDELLLTENHFVMCPIYGRVQGAKIVFAPEAAGGIDVDALLDSVTQRTRVVVIANPNNPTGTYVPYSEIERLHRALPENVVLILDGAYAEYVIRDDFDAGAGMVEGSVNVVMTRTFSKIYGLSGLRIGWAYTPTDVLAVLQRIRTPFNTNCAALAAAAVRDQEFVADVRRHNAEWLTRITEALEQLGLEVTASVANFYLVDFANSQGRSAGGAAAHLEQHGIIPRPVHTGSADSVLRITVGTDDENEAVLTTLRAYMSGSE